jgi:hypothetical protein
LQDCKQNLEEQVCQLQTVEQNIKTIAYKKIVVVELSGSPISSSTIATSPTICEKNVIIVDLLDSLISYLPYDAPCKTDVVDLCFKTNDCLFLLGLKNTLQV